MWVGVTTTGIAVGILLYTLLATEIGDTKVDLNSEILFFVPRVSLAFLVEIFSFFFLRLYSRNLDNAKYLTNELTNVKFKILTLESSYERASVKCYDDILIELVQTERNFILKKGESTVEIERLKLEQVGDFKFIDKTVELPKNILEINNENKNQKR